MVQTRILDRGEVVFGYPRFPMVLQNAQGMVSVLQLSKGVFVYDVRVVRVLEDTGGYPRLHQCQLLSALGIFKIDMLTSSTNQPPLPATPYELRNHYPIAYSQIDSTYCIFPVVERCQ